MVNHRFDEDMSPDVSVVLPVYNHSECIERTFREISGFARNHGNYEFLFVDDGSTDGTDVLMKTCALNVPSRHLCTFFHDRNCGKGAAILAGVRHVQGEIVVLTDGDLPYSLDTVSKVIEALQKSDIAIGSRRLDAAHIESGQRWLRRYLGSIFNWLTRRMCHLPYRDTQAGIKVFRREAIERITARQRSYRFAVDVEMLVIAKQLGLTVSEVAVSPEEWHNSQPSSINLLYEPLLMLIDLLKIRVNMWRGLYD